MALGHDTQKFGIERCMFVVVGVAEIGGCDKRLDEYSAGRNDLSNFQNRDCLWLLLWRGRVVSDMLVLARSRMRGPPHGGLRHSVSYSVGKLYGR